MDTYEQYKDEYERALRGLLSYAPGEIGVREWSKVLGALEDTYPHWQKRYDDEQDARYAAYVRTTKEQP